MNVMFDTNALLDDFLCRAPNDQSARTVIQFVESWRIKGFITANSLTDIFYVMSKNRNVEQAARVIRGMLVTFTVVSVDGKDCQEAIDLPMADFEDALVVTCAEKADVDYIVTNDKEFLAAPDLRVARITPDDFIKLYCR